MPFGYFYDRIITLLALTPHSSPFSLNTHWTPMMCQCFLGCATVISQLGFLSSLSLVSLPTFFVDSTNTVTYMLASKLTYVSDPIIFLFKMWMAYPCLQVNTNSLVRHAWPSTIIYIRPHLAHQSHLRFSFSCILHFCPTELLGITQTSCGFSVPTSLLITLPRSYILRFSDLSSKILFVHQDPV